ncbi:MULTISPECIES: 16S rRNA pseudouridine(516) synthase [Streptococcus]|uniref:16S rRNA pseudouridine(516) synthase n=1 Tax=Streptococcus TaxID=1301 RepID=UPI00025AA182|nr:MULTISPECIES: pseudouridine synthase [Streptococcus]EID26159.1 pseudouridylate synthase [Streptococcus oralis SK1074]EJO20735.1 pseudouridylate synthase [Streptococcus sp. BS35b]ETS89774.1 pseudouridylate synthase [Streptococcus sp. BS29a]EUB27765.1 pseudouridylate synthase [Streptococcus sp. BS21]MCY7104274.1 rRNA pseudouridine synthase [Streptococcus oralis]
MRLDRLLAHEKVSRKAMKQALLKKEILVDDCPARSLSQNIDTGLQKLVFQGRQIQGYEHTYLMLHKPNGSVTASKDKDLPTVMDLLPPDIQSDQLYAIGRLDRDTTGLLLLTDNGPLGFQLLHPQYHVDKSYQVMVNGLLTPEHIQKFKDGIVFLDGTTCKPAQLEILSSSPTESRATITISEGKFHQVKKMFLSVGVKVVSLKRVQFGDFTLDSELAEGLYRFLNQKELEKIKKYLEKSG